MRRGNSPAAFGLGAGLVAALAGCAGPAGPAGAAAPTPIARAAAPADGAITGTVLALRAPSAAQSSAVLAALREADPPGADVEAIIGADDGKTLSVVVPAAAAPRLDARVTLIDGPNGATLAY